jgi:transposase-like protein
MLTIKLEDHEVNFLLDFVKKGHKNARELTRARILLLANQQKGVTEIAKILGVSRNTTFNTLTLPSIGNNLSKLTASHSRFLFFYLK